MPLQRIYLDVVDPSNKVTATQMQEFVQGVLISARVEITPELKKAGVKILVRSAENSSNPGLGKGWHTHDGYNSGCPICRDSYADGVCDNNYV
jgi:hypothetical protein